MPWNWHSQIALIVLCVVVLVSPSQAADSPLPRVVTATRTPRALQTTDVALSSNQVLTGIIYDNSGIPMPQAEVLVAQGSREIARTVTDQQGIFQVSLPHAGLFLVSSGTSVAIARTWVRGTAPPNAVRTIVVEPRTVRSQSALLGGAFPMLGSVPVGTSASASMATVAGVGAAAAAGVIFGPDIINDLKDKSATP